MFIAPDLATFKNHFATRLKAMLTTDSLGAFILVLANSMQDKELFSLLQDDLQQHFKRLQQLDLDAPPDDKSVFNTLTTTGIENISTWQYHSADNWELVINPLRSLRPARVSKEVFHTLKQPFDPDRFHFNKPFLRPEIFWEGEREGINLRVFYNKFPFAPWHLLVVPEPNKTLPQFLTRQYHTSIMQLVATQTPHLPGLGMAFNSIGAYASLNQLHFQGFIRKHSFPIEHSRWLHNGGTEDYPLQCLRTDSLDESWEIITALNDNNQPYNLLYRDNQCYILPRKGQGLTQCPSWAQGIAWHEVCGVFTLPDLQTRGNINDIYKELARLHH